MRIRDKIINRLYRNAKVPDGEISPKWLIIVWRILFPIESFLITNKKFNYFPHKQSFVIEGVEISLFAIREIGMVLNGKEGEGVQIHKRHGNIIWTRLPKNKEYKPEISIRLVNNASMALLKAKEAMERIPQILKNTVN